MELLNLDGILKTERCITIGGEDYPVVEQSVEQMIIGLQVQKQIEKKGKQDDEEIMNRIIDSVSAIIPSCPKQLIRQLPMRAINAIFDFVNASDKEAIANSKDENSGNEPEKK